MMQPETNPPPAQPQPTSSRSPNDKKNLSISCPSFGQIGWKGIVFGIVNLGIFVSSILSCFGMPLGISIGVFGILLSFLGFYCIWSRNSKGLFVFIGVACLLTILSLCNIFVLILQYVSVDGRAYAGSGFLMLFSVIGVILAWDARGRSILWNPA
eukprot:TRINITY_DN6172_c0_g1_i1.p1 TRINITY_DN6172_c0_g1~~TRINITY_DN6172_c0_g1_i1.p1  ORF type:complete len:155 (+),score=24.55 TRINITY_DN6172_c0_g1_i1:50-514(+)